jgi:hypothetical protein
VELVLAGATQTRVSIESGIPRSTRGRLVRRTRQLGQIACVPHSSYRGVTQLHPAFAECIRRLFLLPTRLSMMAIRARPSTEALPIVLHLFDLVAVPLLHFMETVREHRTRRERYLL